MQFLTLRHILDYEEANVGIGPYNIFRLPPNYVDKANLIRSMGGYHEPAFYPTIDWSLLKTNYNLYFGFVSWQQFYHYWTDNDIQMSKWTDAGYLVYEYDIPVNEIISDETQAVAPLEKYNPITGYTL